MKQIDTKWIHPALQITRILSRIYKNRKTTTSGGNISICDENGDIWITPSGIDKGRLSEKDIVCIKKDGNIIGIHKPSSEFPFHKAIYDECPGIKAVLHAHPPAAVAFSIVRQIPDTRIIPLMHNVCGPIGYAKYGLPGSNELSGMVAGEFISGNFKAVIMENHGLVVGGSDLMDAYTRFETLEYCCQIILNAKAIGEPRYLTDIQIQEYYARIPKSFPINTVVNYPPDELIIRKEICDIVRRACEQDLMIGSYGTVSVRWQDNDFLISPLNCVRFEIEPTDIVQIKEGKCEPGKTPSYYSALHQEIYKNNPHINSIILTKSPYAMAFAATGIQLDVRTIPESWIFLQEVPTVGFSDVFNHTIPDKFKMGVSAIIIKNEAILLTGNKLLDTFDKLEVAEFSAKSLVLSSALGKMVPINDEQVAALREKYLR